MTPQAGLLLSMLAFVGAHFLMSHPLRRPLVGALGEKSFKLVYSLVSLATFGAAIYFYRVIGDEPRILAAPDWAWEVAALLMWFAAILFAGSFADNPALRGKVLGAGEPNGVFAITRHPFLWSVALWAMVHAAMVGTAKAMVFDIPLIVLALGGAVAQDRKKERLEGDRWVGWEQRTSYFPFARGSFNPGLKSALIGTLLFLGATWLHPIPVGLWRFIAWPR